MTNSFKILSGKKVAVIVEHKFIAEEIEAYRNCFALLGAELHFVSRIWYDDYKPGHANWKPAVFYSDVDPLDSEPWESPAKLVMKDDMDISNLAVEDYDAIIMSANYTSVRLRYSDLDLKNAGDLDVAEYVQRAPVPRFFAEAMKNPAIIKGALCHGLWILAPFPDLLKDRRVICHSVVMADIRNCGALITPNPDGVVVDNDLVTGYSKHEVLPFIEAVTRQILSRDLFGNSTSQP